MRAGTHAPALRNSGFGGGFVGAAALRPNGIAFLRSETVLDHDVATGLWDRILRLPVGFFRKTTSGDLANRALGLFALRETASRTVKTFLVQSVFLVFFLGQSFWYDWKLALAGLGCLLSPRCSWWR